MEINKESSCLLLNELRKLKESSKEAIEGIESFSTFKEYMHVQRKVEAELLEKLNEIQDLNINKQLVLVCGSVGDGKSHVISQLKHSYPTILNQFEIHNDATESNNPSKSYKEVLDEKLSTFSDEQIEDGNEKRLIVAINLGTLSNFIEDDQYKIKYSRLREYVVKNKIIEDEIVDEFKLKQICFINFSDFSIYELSKEGPKSEFMGSILEKLIKVSSKNPFHMTYKTICQQKCEYNLNCPLKLNYELISREGIRKSIIELVIESIVKFKIIVSARLFLDFIYNILVPLDFEQFSDQKNLSLMKTNKLTHRIDLNGLLPNLLFEHKNRSLLFSGLNQVDPTIDRLEIVDQLMIELNTLNNHQQSLTHFFKDDDLAFLENIIDYSKLSSLDENEMNVLTKTYIRSARLLQSELLPERRLYKSFMIDLYNYNLKNTVGLKELYVHTAEAIFKWNGASESNYINIENSTISKEYMLSQEFKIEPAVDRGCLNTSAKTIYKFLSEIKVSFICKSKYDSTPVDFYLDYDLYELTDKVRRGYRLNKRDREDYIAFIESLKSLIDQGNKHEQIQVTHKLADECKKFTLKKDVFGGYVFE